MKLQKPAATGVTVSEPPVDVGALAIVVPFDWQAETPKPAELLGCAIDTVCAYADPAAVNDSTFGFTVTAPGGAVGPVVGATVGDGAAVAVGVDDGCTLGVAVGTGVVEGVPVGPDVGDALGAALGLGLDDVLGAGVEEALGVGEFDATGLGVPIGLGVVRTPPPDGAEAPPPPHPASTTAAIPKAKNERTVTPLRKPRAAPVCGVTWL